MNSTPNGPRDTGAGAPSTPTAKTPALSPAQQAEVARHVAVIRRGVVDLIEERELAGRVATSLATKTPLRVKFGMDPSSRFSIRSTTPRVNTAS